MDNPRRFGKDPFKVVELLGAGKSRVYKVIRKDDETIVYARKEFLLPDAHDREELQKIHKEISVMKRLDHIHIVKFIQSYQLRNSNTYYLLLNPVADVSLKQFFEQMGTLSKEEPRRRQACEVMCRWPACLFRALDYVHSMRIRHKDIKPGNILIKDDRIYLTDFGVSNDFMKLTTSITEGTISDMTPRYIAPETDEGRRRGKATDIWALGCVILELCTVASGESSLEDLDKHLRGRSASRMTLPFCQSPFLLFDWMWLLLGVSKPDLPRPDSHTGPDVQKLLQLAFLMLDPDPTQRVTSRQLADLLKDPTNDYFGSIAQSACGECQCAYGIPARDIPLHSTFKMESNGEVYLPSRENLSADTPDLWEEVKRRWLKSHIWWSEVIDSQDAIQGK